MNAEWLVEDLDNAEVWPVVHGETIGRRPFSLFRVQRRGYEQWADGRSRAWAAAQFHIDGVHLMQEEDLRSGHISLGFRGLREWLTGGLAGGGLDVIKTDYDAVVRLGRATIDGVDLSFQATYGRSSFSTYEETRQTRAVILADSPTALTLPEWRSRFVLPLRDLILFATRQQVVTMSFSGDLLDREPGGIRSFAVLDQHETFVHGPDEVRPSTVPNLLPASTGDFESIITAWLDLHRKLDGSTVFLFSTLNDPELPTENRLLNLLAFAESYHRRLHDAPPFSDDAHDRFTSEMLVALSSGEARKHYRDRLRFANSQSQRQRLRFLTQRAGQLDAAFDHSLVDQWVATRNWFTHWDQGDHHVVMAPRALSVLCARLTAMIQANLLLDLGLDVTEAARRLAAAHVLDDPFSEMAEDFASAD